MYNDFFSDKHFKQTRLVYLSHGLVNGWLQQMCLKVFGPLGAVHAGKCKVWVYIYKLQPLEIASQATYIE